MQVLLFLVSRLHLLLHLLVEEDRLQEWVEGLVLDHCVYQETQIQVKEIYFTKWNTQHKALQQQVGMNLW